MSELFIYHRRICVVLWELEYPVVEPLHHVVVGGTLPSIFWMKPFELHFPDADIRNRLQVHVKSFFEWIGIGLDRMNHHPEAFRGGKKLHIIRVVC